MPRPHTERVNKEKLRAQKGFLTLGYSMIAFFHFNEFMILLFTILTLLSLPAILLFHSYTTEHQTDWFMRHLELGNMGFA